jgi:cytosine/adenosine deaminase-related metal-dependent hydrolase
MVYLDDADIGRLVRRGVKISHCPTAGLKHTKGLAAHARVPEMIREGVCVSLGGDSGNGSNHFDMLRMMYLVANIYKDARLDVRVMPPETVLEMATIRGAEALLMEREIGSLEPGKRADLVCFDRDQPEWRPLLNPLNNLVYAASGSSVRSVMIDGRLVLDDGRLTTVDERAIYDGWRSWRASRCAGPASPSRAGGRSCPERPARRTRRGYRMKPPRKPFLASASRADSACSRVE